MGVDCIRPPDILCVLCGSARAGGIYGLCQFSVIENHLARCFLYRLVAYLTGSGVGTSISATMVCLTFRTATYVKSVALVPAHVPQNISPGTGGLGLQGLQGPGAAHLITDHTLYIVLQLHHIDYRDISSIEALIKKATSVFIIGEPSPDILCSGHVWQDRQDTTCSLVKLKQDMIRPCFHNTHSVGSSPYNGPFP